MYFNTFLIQFGLDPNDFLDVKVDPIEENGTLNYYLTQVPNNNRCPICNNDKFQIHSHLYQKKKIIIGPDKTYFHIDRIRVKCKKCGKVFTLPLHGIEERATIPNILLGQIKSDFKYNVSFKTIALKYNLSVSTIIRIFDKAYPEIHRRQLPERLCIDEKYFKHEEGKYVTIISNYDTGEIVDIIKDRKDAYLDAYFNKISSSERKKVKTFICDMYPGYSRVQTLFFPNAILIIDLFHTLLQLKNAVSHFRVSLMKKMEYEDERIYNFLKQNWSLFIIREKKIPNFLYTLENGDQIPYRQMVTNCLGYSKKLRESYYILQELYSFHEYPTYVAAADFMDRIIKKLNDTQDEILMKVASTYHAWKSCICEGMVVRKDKNRYTNGLAEGNNSILSRIINVSYGYTNFERFRKRVLLVKTHINYPKKK